MPSCYTGNKWGLMFLKKWPRWITIFQSGVILQLYFSVFFLHFSIVHALIGMWKQDHLHRIGLWDAQAYCERWKNIFKYETSENVILDGLDTWKNKKELICQCCSFEIQVVIHMLTNTNSQTGNKTRETSFLL